MKSVITMGDPNGVGPEIILKAYSEKKFPSNSFVVGDISVLRFCAEKIGLNVPLHICSHNNLKENSLNILDMNIMNESDIEIGKISRKSGAASFEYIKKASKMVIEKKADAIITLPVSKKAIMLSQHDFIGHTEFIADMCGISDYAMMIASDKLITTYVTTHLPVRELSKFIKKERIIKVISLTDEVTKALRGFAKIAIAALNPHAGEEGAFGDEEINEIKPAIEEAKKNDYNVYGPISPDTVFFRAMRGEFNAVVCMYHDQGHIAMKFTGIDDGVNVTLGLPIIRTSVDHGTAFDIAYQGKASISSFVNACKMAEKIFEYKTKTGKI